MGRVDDIAKRFSLAGVLDEDRQAKQRFPVEEIEVAAIEDHPANAAYSMDEDGIASLAESIKKDGLTDIPLVRRKADGGFQMLSGHRRKAAYALLAKEDPAFGRMPCRIVEGIGDDQAVTLLHTANYFTRQLNVVERARATQALGVQVERMRAENPELKGVRTADLKAAIIRNQTGRNISPATVKHQELVAKKVESDLTGPWRERALANAISERDIENLASLPPERQDKVFEEAGGLSKAKASALIREAAAAANPDAAKPLSKAISFLKQAAKAVENGGVAEPETLAEVDSLIRRIRAAG